MQKVEITPKQFAALGRMRAWEGCLETCDGDLPRGCVKKPRYLGYFKPEIGEFPCIFPWNREPTGGDRFADDCFLRHTLLIF